MSAVNQTRLDPVMIQFAARYPARGKTGRVHMTRAEAMFISLDIQRAIRMNQNVILDFTNVEMTDVAFLDAILLGPEGAVPRMQDESQTSQTFLVGVAGAVDRQVREVLGAYAARAGLLQSADALLRGLCTPPPASRQPRRRMRV